MVYSGDNPIGFSFKKLINCKLYAVGWRAVAGIDSPALRLFQQFDPERVFTVRAMDIPDWLSGVETRTTFPNSSITSIRVFNPDAYNPSSFVIRISLSLCSRVINVMFELQR